MHVFQIFTTFQSVWYESAMKCNKMVSFLFLHKTSQFLCLIITNVDFLFVLLYINFFAIYVTGQFVTAML